MLNFIEKFVEELKNSKNNERIQNQNNVQFVSAPKDFTNRNIVYPDNREEKELNALYKEIRELQEKNRSIIEKNKISYNISKN